MNKKNYSKIFIHGFLSVCFLSIFSVNTYAQEVTDADLYKYAVLMETLDLFKTELTGQVTTYVEQQDPAIKNRYNELAGGEAPANDTEKQFIDNVNKMQSERTSEFNEAFKTMVKRVLGAQTYATVKKGIASDSGIKARYDAIVQTIKSAKGDES